MSIIYSHGYYQRKYLDMTMGINTSVTHNYGELQMVNKTPIIDHNPRVRNVHGELQTLSLNVINVSSLHTYYGDINHL